MPTPATVSARRIPIRSRIVALRSAPAREAYSRRAIVFTPASVNPATIVMSDRTVTQRPKSSTPRWRIMSGAEIRPSSVPAA